jgi:dolichyl-phosphate beta-glucosyltransferase
MIVIFATAAVLGFLARGVTRKIFFGRKMTLHQSFSFECVMDSAALLNPFMRKYDFETEFIKREASLDIEVDIWTNAKFASVIFTPILIAMAIGSFRYSIFIAVFMFVAFTLLIALTVSVRSAFVAFFAFLVSYSIECVFFVWALDGLMPWGDAALIYLSFALLLNNSLVPLGIGFAELSVIPFVPSVPGVFVYVLVFHATRVIPSLLLGYVYYARYKFSILDFFINDMPEKLHNTKRPAAGWVRFRSAGQIKASIVIPAYNEEKRLPGFLKDVRNYLNKKDEKFEVIVVDDGSKDETAKIVERIASEDPRIRLLKQIPNQGKGAAVKRGVLDAKGDFVIFADADGATPISELDKFLRHAEQGDDVLVGSRKAGSGSVERKRNLARSIMGFTFYKIVNVFAVPAIKDTQCGFKLFRRDVAEKLFSLSREKGWAFDVELLYLAQMYGFNIIEIPVNWHEVEGSKVNPIKDSMKMFMAIFRIRRNHSGFSNETKD